MLSNVINARVRKDRYISSSLLVFGSTSIRDSYLLVITIPAIHRIGDITQLRMLGERSGQDLTRMSIVAKGYVRFLIFQGSGLPFYTPNNMTFVILSAIIIDQPPV